MVQEQNLGLTEFPWVLVYVALLICAMYGAGQF